MESEKRWCENCMNNTKHEILDSNKVMVGKKNKIPVQMCGLRKEKTHASVSRYGRIYILVLIILIRTNFLTKLYKIYSR